MPPIERAKSNFRSHISQFVTKKQQLIQLGLPGAWADIEADEVTLCKQAAGPC